MQSDAVRENGGLRHAGLKEARLREARLREARLREAGLREAGLKKAALKHTVLKDAALEQAVLKNAVHEKAAVLREAALKEAVGDRAPEAGPMAAHPAHPAHPADSARPTGSTGSTDTAGSADSAGSAHPVRPVPPPPRPGPPGRSPHRARQWSFFLVRALWAAGPAVRGAWLPAVSLVALGALGLSYGGGAEAARPLLLALAPLAPVAGVALSYGVHADPLHEIAAATPSGGLRLLLTRTAAVLAVSLPLLTLTGLLLPAAGAPGAAAWLLPGLALTLASLTLAGWVGCRAATALTGGGWSFAVLAPALTASGGPALTGLAGQLDHYLAGPRAQGAWGAAALLCAALLAARRSAYDHMEKP
ncbi:pentapeptide repeat-containing protein [Streptomyces sp. NBC_00704]